MFHWRFAERAVNQLRKCQEKPIGGEHTYLLVVINKISHFMGGFLGRVASRRFARVRGLKPRSLHYQSVLQTL